MKNLDLILNQFSSENLGGICPIEMGPEGTGEEGLNIQGCINIGSCPGGLDVIC